MTNPYSQPTISGYNSNPPSDDGSNTAANSVKWSTHKDKIGDPLKVFAQAIDTNVLAAFAQIFGQGINSQAGSYTVLTSDQGNFIPVTAAGTITLPAAADAGDGFSLAILNASTGLVVIDANSSETINGDVTHTLGPGEFAILTCNSSLWNALIGRAFGNQVSSKVGDYTVVVGDRGVVIDCGGSLSTVTLLAAATAGNGFVFTVVNNTGSPITIDGNSSETINGSTTITIGIGGSAILFCDGSSWVAHSTTQLSDLGIIRKVKASATARDTTTTLADDDELAGIALTAGVTYKIEAWLRLSCDDATPDFDYAFQLSQTPADAGHLNGIAVTSVGGVTGAPKADMETETTIALTAGGYTDLHVIGYFKANTTNGGTLDLQWAQNQSDANAVTLNKGSFIELTDLTSLS